MPATQLTAYVPASSVGYTIGDQTGSQLPNNVFAAHSVLVDASGSPLGSQSSPLITNTVANSVTASGKSFLAATGVMTLIAAGNVRILFENPVGSGVTAAINAITTLNTAGAAATANFYMNPTVGLPTAQGTYMNALLGSSTTRKCTIKADTNSTALSGGTTLVQIGVPTARTVFQQGQFLVLAGVSVGFNLVFAGAASAELVIYYAEI